MSRRVLCKFFARGACLKGECCEFSHDWKAPPNNICTYYQKGGCSYGSRCRFEHITSIPHVLSNSECCTTPQSRKGSFGCSPSHEVSIKSKSLIPNSTLCPTCGRNCLHPFRGDENEEHKRCCERRQNHVDALKHSHEIECSVCLERVLSKPTSAERKFGLLSECDHPFCITCIRNWRSNSPSSGMDINTALRSCPICRKLSYFVVPSVIWYISKEDKQQIIFNYKYKLKSIDCKYFDFGSGSCPFGASCFYKHAYHDGRLEEVVLDNVVVADGDTIIPKERLPDCLSSLRIR